MTPPALWIHTPDLSLGCSSEMYSDFVSLLKSTLNHYTDVIMGTIASQITSLAIVYSTVYSDADQRKYQSSASLAFVWGIHRRPVNSPHKWPVTRKMFPFDDVITTITVGILEHLYSEYTFIHCFILRCVTCTYLSIRPHIIIFNGSSNRSKTFW